MTLSTIIYQHYMSYAMCVVSYALIIYGVKLIV